MRLSVYMIYVGACLLAIGAAILSGVILMDTFNGQQKESEDAQFVAGKGQVQAMQGIIFNRMTRMQTISEEHSRQLLLFIDSLPDDALLPSNAIQSMNHTIFTSWAPSVRANNSLNGYGLTFMYVNETTGDHFDRTFWVYWDLMTTGQYNYVYAYTSPADDLAHAYRTLWLNFSKPQLADDMYQFDSNAFAANTYKNDDFFDYAQPWVADDGNSYWYFTHMRAFQRHGVYISIQSWDVGLTWLGLMQDVLTEEANLVAFDSQGYVMAASNKDELERLAECRGAFNNGVVSAGCISISAGQYPITEIRDVYNVLHTALWDDVTVGPIPLHQSPIQLSGQRYIAIVATLFASGHLRTTIVWYQPWVVLNGNAVGLTALICILTMLSTFILTLLGVFGVLRPLMALGSAMRVVARTLTEGDRETETVLEPWKRNPFAEVDDISRDFETIVVDFLGFSSANARDNKCAPKDTNKPFAVVFTDIQSSTGLWGRDPAEMSRCVQAHHELIRKLLNEHHLYEVKTVGDSFMATTTSAQDALLFALDVQTTLFEHDWGWPGAEEFYRESMLTFNKPPEGPFASDNQYSELWNGLRVRVGAHYGMGEVKYDEVSKGYDYYGTVVNAAARIEALTHGGQVVVSEDLLAAMPTPLDPDLGVITLLGAFPLRGVAEPPRLLEVKPASLHARTFPPLRVEQANFIVQEEAPPLGRTSPTENRQPKSPSCLGMDQETHSSKSPRDRRSSDLSGATQNSDHRPIAQIAEEFARSHAMVRNGLLPLDVVTQQLLALHHIAEDLLMPLAAQQFTAVAKALAKGWGIAPPKSKADNVSCMRLVQRMSETTKVLTHFSPPHPEAQCTPGPARDELELVEVDLDM